MIPSTAGTEREGACLESQQWGGRGKRIRHSRSELCNDFEVSLSEVRSFLRGKNGRGRRMGMTGRKEENNTDYLEIPFKVFTSCPSFVGL